MSTYATLLRQRFCSTNFSGRIRGTTAEVTQSIFTTPSTHRYKKCLLKSNLLNTWPHYVYPSHVREEFWNLNVLNRTYSKCGPSWFLGIERVGLSNLLAFFGFPHKAVYWQNLCANLGLIRVVKDIPFGNSSLVTTEISARATEFVCAT